MPRRKALHMNSPENDETTVCGRQLERVDWDLSPERVTCKACKNVMRSQRGTSA